MACVPTEDRMLKVDLDEGCLPSMKTLGIGWSAEEDEFSFSINSEADRIITKRSFLKKMATLFDPLGFLSPFTIRAKILLQEMWMAGLDWDDPVDDSLNQKAQKWFKELNDLTKIQIPRCLMKNKEVSCARLHVFVDSSKEAYGAVVYIQHVYADGMTSERFVASKTRVAPLKSMSIPRLELLAGVLGMKLAGSIANVLEIPMSDTIFWSDSMNVLWWIRGHSRDFKPFVANRIGEIQRCTSPAQWRYVPTDVNSADLLTRGITALELIEKDSWWYGPVFLAEPESKWPVNMVTKCKASEEKIKKPTSNTENINKDGDRIITLAAVARTENISWRLEPLCFSSWKRLVRVHAWVYRFLCNCRRIQAKMVTGSLSPEEIHDAEVCIITNTQKKEFAEEYQALTSQRELPKHSKIMGLNPRIDDDGLMRCDGRLKYAEFISHDVRFPVILPRKSWLNC
jgi:hypothetical protein